MYKLIATDLDGTLLDSHKSISVNTKKVLLDLKQKGIKLVLATGRPVEGIRKISNELQIKESNQFAITFNGAAVFELSNLSKPICTDTISGKEVQILAQRGRDLNVDFHAFSVSRGLITEKENPYTEYEMYICDLDASVVDFHEIEDDEQFYKFMFLADKEDLDLVAEKIDDVREVYSVVRSLHCFLEVLAKTVSKGNALISLCKELGIDVKDSIAFGDEENDMHMLQVAGLGIAMKNSNPKVLEIADKVTASNDEDGIAIALETIFADV